MNALRLRAIILFIILSSLSLFFSDNLSFSEEGEKKVCFRWAFGAIVGTDNDRRLVAVTRDTVLKTGDKICYNEFADNKPLWILRKEDLPQK